jgi:hypothetical protein
MLNPLIKLFFIAIVVTLTGCATSYIPPGAKADLQAFAPASIQEGFAAKPTSPFPAGIAFVRVQAPSYTNYRLQQQGGTVGTGRYVVITVREVEEDAQLEQVAKLPRIAGITGINRMLLPARLDSDREIREAAARLQADLIFLYTFDTSLYENDLARPLTVLTLGLSPTRKVYVNTTVSALLLDTRTGYVYSSYESSKRSEALSTSWGTSDTADEARRGNEREAFAQLMREFSVSWPKLLQRHDSAAK